MARAIWTGVISFGLVSVPVELFSATKEHEVSFHQFQRGTNDRIRYLRVNERTGEEVPYGDIVKGADVGEGEHVLIEKKELDEIAPGRSKILDIHQFVDLDEIDPIFFQKTYYLGPGSDETIKTYALLRDAMAETNRAAIATLVMRSKEYLAAIRVDKDLLVLETMYFADEVRAPAEVIERLPGKVRSTSQELRMAGQLIDSMTGEWQAGDFRDTYTDRVKDLVEAKRSGAEVVSEAKAPEATNVIDLMDALRRSVEKARKDRSGSAEPDASTEVPLADMSKAELLDIARDLDISGRSSMNRQELENAIGQQRKAA
ncbi:Ku protein [Hamadaea sp. NPDC051192]|uniref:non-homologous end joining protein Ku n=1 Tax=Hamadaea sp. NPDC051192 TaxID=3154940 RepID=UPI00344282F7